MKKFILSLLIIFTLSFTAQAYVTESCNATIKIANASDKTCTTYYTYGAKGTDGNGEFVEYTLETNFKKPVYNKEGKTFITNFSIKNKVYKDNWVDVTVKWYYCGKVVKTKNKTTLESNAYNNALADYTRYMNAVHS